MKQIIFIFLLLGTQLKAQQIPSVGCSQSTLSIDSIFLPNTNNNYTGGPPPVMMECLSLCGPNTIVYDTAHPSCRIVLINAGCTYVTNSQGCLFADFIFVKSTGTLVIKANANSAAFRVFYEPNATIINQTNGVGTQTFSCASISFPNVNCISTKLIEIQSNGKKLIVYPNPTNEKIFIDNVVADKISIMNYLSQSVFTLINPSSKQEIDLSFLPSGIYFLNAENKGISKVVKIIKE